MSRHLIHPQTRRLLWWVLSVPIFAALVLAPATISSAQVAPSTTTTLIALVPPTASLGHGWSAPKSFYEHQDCPQATYVVRANYVGRCYVYHGPHQALELYIGAWHYSSPFKISFYWGFSAGLTSAHPLSLPPRIDGTQVVAGWDGLMDDIELRNASGTFQVAATLSRTDGPPFSSLRPSMKMVHLVAEREAHLLAKHA